MSFNYRSIKIVLFSLVMVLVMLILLTPDAPKEKTNAEYEAEGKVIYLSFDDGPGPYTGELLDVLKKYDVKATFFVTASYPDYADLIGRAYDEGHSIGIHSYSHNYYRIYDSVSAYKEDMKLMDDIIKEQTGKRTKLFRFPGGSSNTVSNFNPGIMTELSKTLTGEGYYYFDWNVLSGDAGETTDTGAIYYNVISGCAKNDVSVVLMHDIKSYSVAAVESIIKWGLESGYTFLALSEESFPAHHPIAN